VPPPSPQSSPTAQTTERLADALKPNTTPPTPQTAPSLSIPRQLTPKPKPTLVPPKVSPPEPKRSQTALVPSMTSPASKPLQKPASRQEDRNQVAATSTSGQLATRRASQSPPQVQQSRKPGAASKLGGPVSLSQRDLEDNSLAALPNSNRLNRAVDGIDARKDDLGPYLAQLQEKVRQQWIPGLTQSSRRTVLLFTINRTGQVSKLEITSSSGYDVTDEVAINAVKRAAPFAPLPTTYEHNYLNIEFSFSINVYGQLDLRFDN
ncbi:MAG: TonB family protein, partial [Scytonema sp. PMC 1069.18]|nr:TonB family protein [Scytonema sp. PMC 1069.18]